MYLFALFQYAFFNTEEFSVFAMLNDLNSIDQNMTGKKIVITMCLGDNERNPYDEESEFVWSGKCF